MQNPSSVALLGRLCFIAIAASTSALFSSPKPLLAQSVSESPISIEVENLESSFSDFQFVIPEETPQQLSSPNIEVRVVNPAPPQTPVGTVQQPALGAGVGQPRSTSTTIVFPVRSQVGDLPDGSYRLLAAPRNSRFSRNGLPTEGRVFAFRKIGDVVTGTFTYLDTGASACVTGNLEGNTILGQAFATRGPRSRGLRTRTTVSNTASSGLSLQLGNRSPNSAVLNLSGASFINPGTVVSPVVCP